MTFFIAFSSDTAIMRWKMYRSKWKGLISFSYDQTIRVRTKIERIGDLVSDLYFSFQLPDIFSKYVNPTQRTYQYEFEWVNYVGLALIQ
jgi:hypothetical protein